MTEPSILREVMVGPEKPQPRYLTVEEVAAKLNQSVHTVRRWTRDRKIPFFKFGKRLMFEESQLEEWIRSRFRPSEPWNRRGR